MAYEYYDHQERIAYAEELQNQEADKIEEAKFDEALKWAEEEEAKERQQSAQTVASSDPPLSPEDKVWMEEQIKKDRDRYGETFGEDIDEEFE